MTARTLDDFDLSGKRVLVRVDFNVPLAEENGRRVVTDDTRIRAALPTIRKILDEGGTPILMSHLGRPKDAPDPAFSLEPVATYLDDLLDAPVKFVPRLTGEETEAVVDAARPGTVLLLENTRFDPREKANDPTLARALAELGDIYVNDAFGSAHRAHASTAGIAAYFDRKAAGYLLDREIEYLGRGLADPKTPFVAVLGGAKVSDKIGVIEALLDKVDALLIGGAMSYTFLKMLGQDVGTSLVEEDKLDVARELYEAAGGKIKLPVDHVVAAAFDNDAERRTVSGDIPDGFMGLDIGPATVEAYGDIIRSAGTVIWNGPMGVFEMPNFAVGTNAVAQALVEATDAGALTIVGGGDSVAAITKAGLEDRVSHVSTGGGAMLEFLEGKTLPGVAALEDED